MDDPLSITADLFTFGSINFANSSFSGFSISSYAEEQVCQITNRIVPTDRFPLITALPRVTTNGRVVDLSDDALVEDPLPDVRVVED